MCGLVGAFGELTSNHEKMFRDMLIMDTLRGQDSTGVLKVTRGTKKMDIEKELGGPTNLWDYGAKDSMFSPRGIVSGFNCLLMGHNRAATQGSVSVDNAHPFEYKHIVGAHNGTLLTTYGLDDGNSFEVDSRALFNHISKHGITDAWSKMDGAAALSWWDAKDQTLNLIHNKERPLYIAYSKNKQVLFWASEGWMIRIAAKRNNVDLFEPTAKDKKEGFDITFELKYHCLHSYVCGGSAGLKLKNMEELTPRKKNPYSTNMSYPFGGTSHPKSGGTQKSSGTRTNTLKKKFGPKDVINEGWAENSPKGDSKLRGDEILLKLGVEATSTGSQFHYIVGEVKRTGERVAVYPRYFADFEALQSVCESGSIVRAKIISRPRVATNASGSFFEYRLDMQGIKVIVTKKGGKDAGKKPEEDGVETVEVNEQGEVTFENDTHDSNVTDIKNYVKIMDGHVLRRCAEAVLKNAGSRCGVCNDPLSLEREDEIVWVSKHQPVCTSCNEDQQDMVQMLIRQG